MAAPVVAPLARARGRSVFMISASSVQCSRAARWGRLPGTSPPVPRPVTNRRAVVSGCPQQQGQGRHGRGASACAVGQRWGGMECSCRYGRAAPCLVLSDAAASGTRTGVIDRSRRVSWGPCQRQSCGDIRSAPRGGVLTRPGPRGMLTGIVERDTCEYLLENAQDADALLEQLTVKETREVVLIRPRIDPVRRPTTLPRWHPHRPRG